LTEKIWAVIGGRSDIEVETVKVIWHGYFTIIKLLQCTFFPNQRNVNRYTSVSQGCLQQFFTFIRFKRLIFNDHYRIE